AALERTLPEPRAVRSAVLSRRASEVWPARKLRAPGPEQHAADFDLRCKHLILQIAMREPDLVYQLEHPFRFCDIARQRFLAGDADQFAFAALDGTDHLFHDFDAGVGRAGGPERVDPRILCHRG